MKISYTPSTVHLGAFLIVIGAARLLLPRDLGIAVVAICAVVYSSACYIALTIMRASHDGQGEGE